MKMGKVEGVTRGDKLYESREGEKFYGDTGEDSKAEANHVIIVKYLSPASHPSTFHFY